MSLIITGTNTLILLFFLIGINGFFCFKRIPVLGVPIAGISILCLIGFQIEYIGINIILMLVLLVMAVGNGYLNTIEFKRK